VQLGYFCLQLPAMQAAPDQPRVRAKRTWPISACSASFNPFPLPAMRRCADLAQPAGRPARLLELARPKCW
jgi:hypothetical protein